MTPHEIKKKYDYLDKLSHARLGAEPWLWEFIRRNREYRDFYRELSKKLPEAALYFRGPVYSHTDTFLESPDAEVQELLSELQERFGIKANARVDGEPDGNYLKKQVEYQGTLPEKFIVGFPNPDVRYCDFKSRPVIRGAKPVAIARMNERADSLRERNPLRFNEYCSTVIHKISPSIDLKNTLFIGIALDAKKEDLKKHLEQIIDEHIVEPKKVKFLPEKWKFYLIAYDLSTRYKFDYETISDLLSEAYPGDPNGNDWNVAQNVKNYKKTATELITSDFARYMYLNSFE